MILEVISLLAKMNAIPLLRAKSFGFVLLDGIECKEALNHSGFLLNFIPKISRNKRKVLYVKHLQ